MLSHILIYRQKINYQSIKGILRNTQLYPNYKYQKYQLDWPYNYYNYLGGIFNIKLMSLVMYLLQIATLLRTNSSQRYELECHVAESGHLFATDISISPNYPNCRYMENSTGLAKLRISYSPNCFVQKIKPHLPILRSRVYNRHITLSIFAAKV